MFIDFIYLEVLRWRLLFVIHQFLGFYPFYRCYHTEAIDCHVACVHLPIWLGPNRKAYKEKLEIVYAIKVLEETEKTILLL